MDTSGFYTTNEQGELMHAPNYVIAPDFAIYRDQREAYTYPVHGWVMVRQRGRGARRLQPSTRCGRIGRAVVARNTARERTKHVDAMIIAKEKNRKGLVCMGASIANRRGTGTMHHRHRRNRARGAHCTNKKQSSNNCASASNKLKHSYHERNIQARNTFISTRNAICLRVARDM